jgi:uncharacterized protein (DUF1697 family)
LAQGRLADEFLFENKGAAQKSQGRRAPFGRPRMSRRIVLLRGVNVGGRNTLPMKTFAGLLEGRGCTNVATYIQSGNAVITGAASAADIAAAIKRAAGFTCHVFVLTAAALRKAADACPFRREAAASGKSVHVFFLDEAPFAAAVEALGAVRLPREDFAVAGRALYLYSPDGAADSKIARTIDRTIGAATTARNWNTIEKLLAMAEVG